MKTLFAVTSLSMACASGAFAGEVTYSNVGFGYSNLSIAGEDAGLYSYGGALEYAQNNWVLGVSAGVASPEDLDIDLMNISVSVAYEVMPGAYVLGGYRQVDGTFDGTSLDTETWSVGGEFTSGGFSFGLGYMYSPDLNEGAYSAFANYALDAQSDVYLAGAELLGENAVLVGASRYTNKYSADAGYAVIASDLDVFSVSGSYNFMPYMRVSGDVARVSLDGIDANYWGIGLGYAVAQNSWIDASYGQIKIEGETADILSLTINFETGKSKLATQKVLSNVSDLLPKPLEGVNF